MPKEITYVMVKVTGVEDSVGVQTAIENLSNSEQQFYVLDSKTTTTEDVAAMGEPVIYFP